MAAELMDQRVERAIHETAEAMGFAVEHPTVEMEGLCAACRHQPEHDSTRLEQDSARDAELS